MAQVHQIKPGNEDRICSLQLRIPMSVRDAISKEAIANIRSLNDEIIWRLVQSLKAEGKAVDAD